MFVAQPSDTIGSAWDSILKQAPNPTKTEKIKIPQVDRDAGSIIPYLFKVSDAFHTTKRRYHVPSRLKAKTV